MPTGAPSTWPAAARFADHASFALAGLASLALAAGDLREAEELAVRHWPPPRLPRRRGPPLTRESGSREPSPRPVTRSADRLCAPSWSGPEAPRMHGPRESLFVALAGDPAAAARDLAAEPRQR